jgi:hypothetical protein
LKTGLSQRSRTVLLMLDETIITETPPLYSCYGRIGQQVSIPISGGHARRILHGTINVHSGEVFLWISKDWTQVEHRHFLCLVRNHWRGWHIVLFEDRASQHTCPGSVGVADRCGMGIRLLPKSTPKLNAMDHLWRHTKRQALGDRATVTIDHSAQQACDYILDMSPRERLREAGVLSGSFWLTT